MPSVPRWRVVFGDRPEVKLYSFQRVITSLKIWENREFDIYGNFKGQWKLIFHYTPREYCNCGRLYNGFKFRDSLMDNPKTVEASVEWFRLPVLCQYCYYSKEIGKGHWAPKNIRKELGLEN